MAAKSLPSAEYLHQCFDYDRETGVLTWRPDRPREHFATSSGYARWSAFAGMTAGTLNKTTRYRDVLVGNRRLYVHRIIWKMMTGNDPKAFIDHVNGDPSDNRWGNLRAATREQNQWNSSWNGQRSLPRGVSWNGYGYCAGASSRNRHVYLGTFDTPEEAHSVYCYYITSQRGNFGRVD